jgi:Inhibitor of Apoptosis domain/Zinc finger, C3HC4 type (RING finger)
MASQQQQERPYNYHDDINDGKMCVMCGVKEVEGIIYWISCSEECVDNYLKFANSWHRNLTNGCPYIFERTYINRCKRLGVTPAVVGPGPLTCAQCGECSENVVCNYKMFEQNYTHQYFCKNDTCCRAYTRFFGQMDYGWCNFDDDDVEIPHALTKLTSIQEWKLIEEGCYKRTGKIKLFRNDHPHYTHAMAAPASNLKPIQISPDLTDFVTSYSMVPTTRFFSSNTQRLQSYAEWPRQISQTPESLAEAGFFYMGQGDKVYCYHCGKGMNNWETGDDPWIEHAKHAGKTCTYLLLMKGVEFIRLHSNVPEEPDTPPPTNIKVITFKPEEESEFRVEGEGENPLACKVCLGEEMQVIFSPCNHILCCVKCTLTLTDCPYCRTPIKKAARIHFA